MIGRARNCWQRRRRPLRCGAPRDFFTNRHSRYQRGGSRPAVIDSKPARLPHCVQRRSATFASFQAWARRNLRNCRLSWKWRDGALREKLVAGNALNSPSAVRDYLRLRLQSLPHEVFVALFLDAQHRVIGIEELFRGTLTQTSVYPREVVKRALHHNAGAMIFAHNHPSGVAEPSHADETLTQALKQALALVDVRVIDHFIVAGSGVLSFAERGLI